MTFANVSTASVQTKYTKEDLLLLDNLKTIDAALVELSHANEINSELKNQIILLENQIELMQGKINTEHNIILETKKLYLTSLETLATYRIKKRPLVLKIITFSLIRDYHDKELEKKISDLKEEIKNWK